MRERIDIFMEGSVIKLILIMMKDLHTELFSDARKCFLMQMLNFPFALFYPLTSR